MTTPEKNQTRTTSLSKFEDSPVFKFINGLSPIKPVKSIRIPQTFNSISSPSLPSIFTSPTRQNHSDPAQSVSANEERIVVLDQLLEIYVPEIHFCDNGVYKNPRTEDSISTEEFSEKVAVKYEGKPWESSISDAAELLIFSSPIISGAVELIQKPFQATGFSTNLPISNVNRCTRRRCLDFETAADDCSKLASSSSSSSSSSSRSALPGIGLHLNAVAASLKDQKPANSENFSIEESLLIDKKEEDLDRNEPNLIDPMKNRENSGSCKRCNCKKSRCLKLYCECFAAGVYCIEPCSCQECFNKPIHEDVVLETRRQIESRNPLAFAPKVIVNSDLVSEAGDDSNKTPAPARHKTGCNCKKSSCLKKYCECFQGGVGCSDNCRCEGCKNAFGRKDESALIRTETQQEEEERETYQDQNADEQQNPSCCRSVIPLPFQMKRKLPSCFLDDRCSSRLSVRFKLEKQSINQTQPKVEEEIPEIVRTDCCSGTAVKTVSPNSTRVTPPPPPARRIGRKLILQAVPSFPSLTHQKLGLNGPSKL